MTLSRDHSNQSGNKEKERNKSVRMGRKNQLHEEKISTVGTGQGRNRQRAAISPPTSSRRKPVFTQKAEN